MTEERFPASAYLRGRQCSVRLHALGQDGQPDPALEAEQVWFSLSNNHIARIEEEFGGVAAFDEAFTDRPTSTLRRFFAIAFGAEVPVSPDALDAVGARMIDVERPAYMAALDASWHLAHGMEEADAGKVWEGRRELVKDGREKLLRVFERLIREAADATPGTSGAARGRRRADRSPNSGA
jgi:hypothetical protein